MNFVFVDDREFLEFNLSWSLDETLRAGSGPRESDLYALVQKARKGDADAANDYADTMYWTLRGVALDTFQRTFGARGIEHRDWFYSKLYQFFRILLHDKIEVLGNGPLGYFGPPNTERPWEEGEILRGSGRSIDPDELEAAFSVGEEGWEQFVQIAIAAGEDRFERVRALVRERVPQRAEPKPAASRKSWQWTDNVKRDQIIVEGLAAGRTRPEICQILDQHYIPTTSFMRQHGYTTWGAGWNDKEIRRTVQSVFSKVSHRKVVKG